MAGSIFVCLCYFTWLLYTFADGSGPVFDSQAYSLLPPLFKELSERPGWREKTPAPQSVAVKYMKRLYKMLTTKEGVPKAHKNAEYNTVRLFTPKSECHPRQREEIENIRSLDLSFSFTTVSSWEQNLRSVLLYYVRKQYSSLNITCACSLDILHIENASQICPQLSYTFDFQLKRKQRWIEIDVTSFIQPFVSSQQNIHLLFNMTCMRNKVHYSFGMTRPIKIVRSPCLLLYLNDTSNKAYHRKKMQADHPNWPKKEHASYNNELTETLQISKVLRSRRGHDIKGDSPVVESMPYNISELAKQFVHHQNDCELHRFRLSFSQLNWDKWILAPHRYSPDYCKGTCPRIVGHKYGSPVHTIVQNIIYEKLDPSIPRPSCVPVEYRPMSVLTIEPDNSIAYKEYQDMIATQCTCR